MKKCLIITLALLGACTFSEQSLHQSKNYANYCNFYTSTTCFILRRGDLVTQRIPIDFVIYDLVFGSKDKITIYEGLNPPEVSPDFKNTNSKCSGVYKQCSLLVNAAGEGKIVFQRKIEEEIFVATVENLNEIDGSSFSRFLSELKACESSNVSVKCDQKPIFSTVNLDLFREEM